MIEFGNRTSKMRRVINSLKRTSDREQPFWRGTGLEKKMDGLNPLWLKKAKATDAKRALLKKRKKRYEQWGSTRTAKKVSGDPQAMDRTRKHKESRGIPTKVHRPIDRAYEPEPSKKEVYDRLKRKYRLEALDELMEFRDVELSKALGVHRMRTKVVDGKKRFKDWNEDYAIAKRKFIKARDKKRAKG